MGTWDVLQERLRTDPRDAGCAETFALIHTYAELVVSGRDPEELMPGVTLHLEQCGPCAEDYVGLLAALRGQLDG